jgi:hypothetical protein
MKKNLLTLLSLIAFGFIQAQNVPNGGFETWAAGNPANWYTDNAIPVAVPVTQATPAHGGSFAAKGQVVTASANILPPLLESSDAMGNGFAVTQAYSTLSFYYKTSLTSTDGFAVLVAMNDASHSGVGVGAAVFTGTTSMYTLATVPIYYSGSNPVECIIEFTIFDTTSSGSPVVGDYFIVDDVSLSGLASVHENTSAISISKVYPNPANRSALVQYYLPVKSDVQIQVLNTQGKTVGEITLPEQSAGKHDKDIDVSAIPAGFYILRMKTKEGITFSRLQVAR